MSDDKKICPPEGQVGTTLQGSLDAKDWLPRLAPAEALPTCPPCVDPPACQTHGKCMWRAPASVQPKVCPTCKRPT